MKTRYIVSGAIANIYGQFVTIGVQLISVPILIAHWGLSDFGLWTMLITIPTLLLAMDFGYSAASAGFMSKALANRDHSDARVSFHTALLIVVVIAAFMSIVAIAITFASDTKGLLLGGLSARDMSVLIKATPWMIGYVAVSLISGMVNAVFRVNGHYPTGVVTYETGRLIEQVAVMTVAVTGHNVETAAATSFAIRLTSTMVSMVIMWSLTDWLKTREFQYSSSRCREMFAPAIAAMFVPLCVMAGVQGVTLIVGSTLSPAAAGAFASVRVLFRLVVQFVAAIIKAIVPDFAHIYAGRDSTLIGRVAKTSIVLAVVIGVIGTVSVVIIGPWFLSKWTHGTVAVPLIVFIILGSHSLFGSVWNSMSTLLTSINKQASFVAYLLFNNVIVVGALSVMIAGSGIVAAALAVATIDALSLVTLWSAWRRAMPTDWLSRPIGLRAGRGLNNV